ncbi:MAG: DUF4465 domain-containing protein [Bacteroidales bacterium]|nr:DUF4465 domain-containing protein [Bacteroidales bacterium]MDD3990047.1 DUF4465 domain-containing protein [Bacteroidales bacterium]MDD4638318.1 DUF4465 domain-containing protein [Bacteroidales bacterium]
MKRIIFLLIFGLVPFFYACSDKSELLVPIPDDITFNELQLSPYTHNIPDNGFTSKGVTFNTKKNGNGTYSGFAYSNQNNRSFVWSDSQTARDTNLYSVYTSYRNMTEVFAVACANSEADTYFTIQQPTIVEHILVANTTYNYLAMTYGVNSGTSPIANPNIPSAPKAIWNTFAPGVTRKLNLTGDYYKIIAKGYNGNTQTGTVDIYLCCRKTADPANPDFAFLRTDWVKADLTALGAVTKVTFSTESSYEDGTGNDLIHSWFCIDGIRLKK